ncbi:hypothetical protein TNCV_4922371 [Trichonephila clavipes]|nr:hypothetical protein TNCV_4922371 [Trichonephila clavipes]
MATGSYMTPIYSRSQSIQTFDQKSPGWLDMALHGRLTFWKIPGMSHCLLATTYIQAMRSSNEERRQTLHVIPDEVVHVHFRTPVVAQPFNEMLSVPLMCCCSCSFSRLLCTIARNSGI